MISVGDDDGDNGEFVGDEDYSDNYDDNMIIMMIKNDDNGYAR